MPPPPYAGRWGPHQIRRTGPDDPLPNHDVRVWTDSSELTLASLWEDRDRTVPITQPLVTTSQANLTFYADPGDYWMVPDGFAGVDIHVFHDGPDTVSAEEDGEIISGNKNATGTWEFSGSTVRATVNFEPPEYAVAGLPAGAATGSIAHVTDDIRGFWQKGPAGWHSVSESANATDFGAVGDGVTDDTAAIQAAQDAVEGAGGGTLVLSGTLLISATITCDSGNIRWVAKPGTILKASTNSFDLVTLTSGLASFEVEGLEFQGAATTNATTQYGIFTGALDAPNEVKILRCAFSGPNGTTGLNNGIKNDGGFRWTVAHCRFERLIGTISGTGYGYLAGTASDGHIHDNVFIGVAGQGRHAVYLTAGTSDHFVHDNIVDGMNLSGIAFSAIGAQAANTRCHVHHNTVINSGDGTTETAGIEVFGKGNNIEVTENLVIGFDGDGYMANDGGESGNLADIVFKGNTARACERVGFNNQGGKRVRYLSNYAYDNSQASLGLHSGFRLASVSTAGTEVAIDTHYAGNVSIGAQQRAGFEINATAPTPTGTILGTSNQFQTGNVADIQLNGVTDVKGRITSGVTFVWDPPSLADGAQQTRDITVTDAQLGDQVSVSFTQDLAGTRMSAQVQAVNNVRVLHTNESGGPVDLASGTLTVMVERV